MVWPENMEVAAGKSPKGERELFRVISISS